MPDVSAMLHCHHCNSDSPTKAEDGQKRRCYYCGVSLTVIRYPDFHPRSLIGQNTFPVTTSPGQAYTQPETGAVIVPRRPADIKRARNPRIRVKNSKTLIPRESEAANSQEIVSRMTNIAKDMRGMRTGRNEPAVLDNLTPTNIRYCDDCVTGNFKANNSTFARAEYTAYPQGSTNQLLLCRAHTEARLRGFIPGGRIDGDSIRQIINPGPPPAAIGR